MPGNRRTHFQQFAISLSIVEQIPGDHDIKRFVKSEQFGILNQIVDFQPVRLLLTARQLTRDLGKQAQLGLELPPEKNSNLGYKVLLESGTVAFSDTSRGNPQSFFQLAAFTKDVSERVCGIVRQ